MDLYDVWEAIQILIAVSFFIGLISYLFLRKAGWGVGIIFLIATWGLGHWIAGILASIAAFIALKNEEKMNR